MKITPADVVSQPIVEGDCGIIVRQDGRTQVFTSGNEADADFNLVIDEARKLQVEKIMVLAAVLQHEDLYLAALQRVVETQNDNADVGEWN